MLNSLELFCGAGGLALGLQKAGIDHEGLFEWDKTSCDNIQLNINRHFELVDKWRVHHMDVRNIDYSSYRGRIDIISGGPPCQPFSVGGLAKAYNDKRDMFPEAIRAVRELAPKAFIFENVKGLLRKSFSTYFSYILLQLQHPELTKKNKMTWEDHVKALERYHTSNSAKGLQYNVIFRGLNVADYGVPQSRNRVIIVGFRSDINAQWSFPAPTHSREALLYDKWISGLYWKEHNLPTPDNPLSDRQLIALSLTKPSQKRWRTVRDAIGDMPSPKSAKAKKYHNHEYRGGAKVYAGHTGSALDEPSKTIKAGVHGVPGGENMIVLDDGTTRYYTTRESARIQTFPDNYLFGASWTENMRQIGNAVPVELAYIIGKSVVSHLGA